MTQSANLPESLTFAVFMLNSGGTVAGHFLAGRVNQQTGKARVGRIAVLRSFLTLGLVAAMLLPLHNVALATAILMLMGFAYALFLVYTLSLSMDLIPQGKAGLFNVLIGIGGACGSFVCPFVAQTFGFFYVFLLTGAIFLTAYIALKLFG
jgi:MFS family permease